MERSVRPNVWDHVRHCALLYACVIPLGPLMFATLSMDDPGAGGAIAILVVFTAGYAIIVNALMLFAKRYRSTRAQLGGAA